MADKAFDFKAEYVVFEEFPDDANYGKALLVGRWIVDGDPKSCYLYKQDLKRDQNDRSKVKRKTIGLDTKDVELIIANKEDIIAALQR